MSLTAEERRGRAQKAARRRWHGDDAATTPEIAQLEAASVDRAVDILKASWRSATAEQKDQLRRLFNPPAKAGG